MKPYETYQHLPGTEMTERDKKEQGSKFWNKGKWDNFVKPFLTEDPKEKILVDMGCNAGIFLKLAEDMGFKAIGVDSNEVAVKRGQVWRDEHSGTYKIIQAELSGCLDDLPMADYTVLANAHYYFTVNEWFEYLDKLQYKTRYCIIVTDEKRQLNRCWASSDVEAIRRFFKNWDEVGFIDLISPEGDPSPRKLRSLCFKSRFIDRAPLDALDSSNHVQDTFYGQLEGGKSYEKTKYFWIIEHYRKNWTKEKLHAWFQERIKLYEGVKKDGLKIPIIVDQNNLILDGNHRYSMLKSLGYKETFIRKT